MCADESRQAPRDALGHPVALAVRRIEPTQPTGSATCGTSDPCPENGERGPTPDAAPTGRIRGDVLLQHLTCNTSGASNCCSWPAATKRRTCGAPDEAFTTVGRRCFYRSGARTVDELHQRRKQYVVVVRHEIRRPRPGCTVCPQSRTRW